MQSKSHILEKYKRENKLSRFLTKVLRHQGRNMGLHIEDDGTIPISDLLNHPAFSSKHYTLEEVQRVVKNNDCLLLRSKVFSIFRVIPLKFRS